MIEFQMTKVILEKISTKDLEIWEIARLWKKRTKLLALKSRSFLNQEIPRQTPNKTCLTKMKTNSLTINLQRSLLPMKTRPRIRTKKKEIGSTGPPFLTSSLETHHLLRLVLSQMRLILMRIILMP